ncbi:MAG: glycosyltransferase family 2 protein [Candidatus Lokiarchaeota archaeon]|nr:glycosyltransferase family 2 protein [Candidatus Lokiarchaeota archaeon]
MKALESIKNSSSLIKSFEDSDPIEDSFLDLYEFIDQFKSKDDRILISIILPMFNEEQTIGKVLRNLPRGNMIEIIVVDDHSQDNSLKEIERINKFNEIKVIKHDKNRGYGAAVVTGINVAQGEVIVTMDSDGQHSPYDILEMIKPILLDEADYTIGSRYLGSYFYKLPVSTRLGELLVEKLIQIFFGKKIMNNQNGFRAFNRKVITIFKDFKYEGYAFCTEQIIRATMKGFRIKECPIKVYDRKYGTSNIILTKLTVNLFSCILQYILVKLNITIFKRLSSGQIQIYREDVKGPKIFSYARYTRDINTVNPVFFIERSSKPMS